MALDPTTESIAHFVGLFRLLPDGTRFHQDYERIASETGEDAESQPLDLGIAAIRVSHDLEGVAPKLSYSAPDHSYTYQSVLLDQPAGDGAGKSLSFQIGLSLPSFDGPALGSPSAAPGRIEIEIEIPPPGSLIAVTVQRANLSDDDLFGAADGQGFEPVGPLTDVVRLLAATAETLSPIAVDLAHGSDDWAAMAEEALETLPSAGRAEEETLSITTLRGEGAYGIHVDGASENDMPLWTAFRPAHFVDKDLPLPPPSDAMEEDPEADAADRGFHDFSRDFGADEPAPIGLGHQVITGANVAVNHVSLVSNWLDAPVIAVAGDVFHLDAISQVNLLVEHDWAPGTGGPASTAINAAELARSSSRTEDDATAEQESGAAGAPANWSVVRVEGDVVQINWVDQFTFATDHDRANVTVSGSSTEIGLGENQIVNEAFFWELGWAYDLIVVGGDLIDLSVIKQTNVLLDSDIVHGTDAAAGAGDPPEAAGPVVLNGGGATPGEARSDRDVDIASTAPDGEPAVPCDAAASDPASPEPAASSAAGNLLWNEARIETIGRDVHERLDDAFADTIRKMADGADEIDPEVAMHPMFDGTDLIKVLHISGDFVTVDKITQTNVLGDADQVNLAREAFAADLKDQIAVTTGSNLTANIAEIVDDGMDSTVMAGGDTYSDALIHQAELIDAEPIDHGGIASLATEAVAFLADDMIAGMPSAAEISARTDAAVAETAGQSDVMQTVLA